MCKTSASNKTAFSRILVGVDASKQSEWATQTAGALAQATGARVALAHAYRVEAGYSPNWVRPIEELLEEQKQAAKRIVEQRRSLLPVGVAVEEMLAEGEAARQIVSAAERWHADLIVMGTHGRGRLSQFLVGSVADAVIRKAPCPVLSVAHEPPPKAVNIATGQSHATETASAFREAGCP